MIRAIFFIFWSLFFVLNAYAEEDILSLVEGQRTELTRKEHAIKKETERLEVLKKDIDESIEKYTRLLRQIEETLKEAEGKGNKRLRHVAKAYEAMSPEDAAQRLSGLDNVTAVKILLKMNSKKAGLVIGMMGAEKATRLTKEIARLQK